MSMKYFFKSLALALVGGFISITGSAQTKTYNITTYGAVADGKTNNTIAIQKAINEASAGGGGRVVVPAGKFITGVLTLQSNVDLHVDKGAFLLGSAIRADYGEGKASPLIVSNNQHHIAITGQGTIDGQGDELIKEIYSRLNAGTLQDTEWKTPSLITRALPVLVAVISRMSMSSNVAPSTVSIAMADR